MYQFYIPILYLIHSRLKTKFDLISWQIIFVIPQFMITYFYVSTKSEIFIQIFFISLFIFHTLYEVGYIENDIITTKNEKKPTKRLSLKETAYLNKNYLKVINLKYFICIFFIILLFWIDAKTSYNLNLIFFLVLLVVNRLIFFIHNSIRNRFNAITFLFLSVIKYTFPLILFIDFEKILYPVIIMIFAFPVLRTIEVLTLKKHNLKNISRLVSNIDRFRILYYIIILVMLVVSWYFFDIGDKNFLISIFLISYFLIFRICTKFLIEKGIYKRDTKTKPRSQYLFK